MPENHRQAGGAQSDGGEHRHLTNTGEGGEHHDEIGHHGRQQRQQQRAADFGKALPRRGIMPVDHTFREIVQRIVGGDTDNAHAHHQRHQMQFAKQQQRDDGARQPANANGNHAQQQRTKRTESRNDKQDHAKQRGDAEGGDILLRLLAGVVAVKHRPAGEHLCLRVARF